MLLAQQDQSCMFNSFNSQPPLPGLIATEGHSHAGVYRRTVYRPDSPGTISRARPANQLCSQNQTLFFRRSLTWLYYQIITSRWLVSLRLYGPCGPLVRRAAFLLYRMFTRVECTKSSTVLFTRSGRDNKSVCVCVPAVLCACAHMPACAHVRPLPRKCASETAVHFYEALQLVSSVWTLSRSLTLSVANK